MINNKFPILLQLFSCYFHQDWPEEFDSPEMVIDAFVELEPAESIKMAHKELKIIIDSGYSNDEILSLLTELGCYYEPTADHTSALNWLKSVEKILSSR